MSRRHPNVINKDEVAATEGGRGDRYAYFRRQLGAAAGGRALGASYMELPPGRSAWPAHFHCANEEAIFVIQGTGTLRLGIERSPLRSGDSVALPAGPTEHQIINDSTGPLSYLAFSTMVPTDVVVYTDSAKLGVFGGSPPGGTREGRIVEGFFKLEEAVDYWEGETVLDEDPEDELA